MIETMASRSAAPAVTPTARTLRPADVTTLRLPGRRSSEVLRQALSEEPGRSVWIPETLEYALIRSWRSRPEIAHVDELVAVRHLDTLLQGAFDRAVERNDALLLAIELERHRGPSRFERAGLALIEEVITYEIDVARIPRMPQRRFRLVPIEPGDTRALDLVTALDQAAFPWLWRNNRQEFDAYVATPGAEASLIEADGEPVAYVGTTLFPAWGHLDRIAVAPSEQGRGFGRAALILAVDSLRRRGARRIGLSTQRTNGRSQRLYERFGFQRTPALDYQLYGAWCDSPTAPLRLPD